MRVIGLAGWSGAGKTTLMVRLIPLLRARGLTVSTCKHAHHRVDVDRPGKDSWLHREAGASEVMLASGGRWALMHELRGEAEPELADLLARFSPVDLVIVEGFKRSALPKIEVHRGALGKPLLHPDDAAVVAIAALPPVAAPIPSVSLDDTGAVADLILDQAVESHSLNDGASKPFVP